MLGSDTEVLRDFGLSVGLTRRVALERRAHGAGAQE